MGIEAGACIDTEGGVLVGVADDELDKDCVVVVGGACECIDGADCCWPPEVGT